MGTYKIFLRPFEWDLDRNDGYLAVGLVTAEDDIVYIEEIHTYEEAIEFKIDENYDDFVKGNKYDFIGSIKAQLVSILQCEPLNVRDLEVFPESFTVNFTLVGSNDMEADKLKQSHAELIALLEAGALKLVSFFDCEVSKEVLKIALIQLLQILLMILASEFQWEKQNLLCSCQAELAMEVKPVFK